AGCRPSGGPGDRGDRGEVHPPTSYKHAPCPCLASDAGPRGDRGDRGEVHPPTSHQNAPGLLHARTRGVPTFKPSHWSVKVPPVPPVPRAGVLPRGPVGGPPGPLPRVVT